MRAGSLAPPFLGILYLLFLRRLMRALDFPVAFFDALDLEAAFCRLGTVALLAAGFRAAALRPAGLRPVVRALVGAALPERDLAGLAAGFLSLRATRLRGART